MRPTPQPELLKAVAAAETLVRIGNQVIKAQQGMGAILPEDLRQRRVLTVC